MNKKKRHPILFVLIMLVNVALTSQAGVMAENISPIESVDWLEESSEAVGEESSQEESEEAEETTESESPEESSETVETDDAASEEESQASTNSLDTSNPLAFLESLSQFDRRTVEYVNFMSEGENVEMVSQNTLIDGEKFYTAQLIPPFLPQALFLQSYGEAVQSAHLSLDDLIKYSADALNTQPQIYEGTVVEEFYSFAQENYDALVGKVVEVDPATNDLAGSTLEVIRIESYLTEVALEWLGREEVLAAFESNELGEQVLINGDLATSFNEIAQAKQANYPELAEFFEVFVNVEGTINADYSNGVFGFGLLVPNSEDNITGLELYIAQSQGEIIDFADEIVFTYDEFSELVGSDVIQQINELESGLTADQFVQATE